MRCCPGAFKELYLQRGWATTCCPIWYEAYDRTPNYQQSPQDLWMSAILENFRQRVGANDFGLCGTCPFITKHIPTEVSGYEGGPETMYVGDSFVCNLQCWSCRDRLIINEPNSDEADLFLRKLIDGYRSNLKKISFLHTGEIFASKRHTNLLKTFEWENIDLELITNATLVEHHFDSISSIHHKIKRVTISLDASNENTYSKVRLGGNWNAAVRGVKILAQSIPNIDFTYVVSVDNVDDVLTFCNWAQQFNPSLIKLVKVAYTYPRSDWASKDPWLVISEHRTKLQEVIEKCRLYKNVLTLGFD
jgi:sulfatase maturation enzyme AslB (radical SAM superfamily)